MKGDVKKDNGLVFIRDIIKDIVFLDIENKSILDENEKKIAIITKRILSGCLIILHRDIVKKDNISDTAGQQLFKLMSSVNLVSDTAEDNLATLSNIASIWETLYNLEYINWDHFRLVSDSIIAGSILAQSIMQKKTSKTRTNLQEIVHVELKKRGRPPKQKINSRIDGDSLPNDTEFADGENVQKYIAKKQKYKDDAYLSPSKTKEEEKRGFMILRRNRIKEILFRGGPQSLAEIVQKLEYKSSGKTVNRDLTEMAAAGEILVAGKKRWVRYRIAETKKKLQA